MEEEELRKSKFNTAVSKEIRRGELWKEANAHSRAGLFQRWSDDLDCIWSELAADISPVKFEGKKEEFDKLSKVGIIKDKRTGFKKLTINEMKLRSEQYDKLREKELFLRRIENELGKGTAWEQEDEDSF